MKGAPALSDRKRPEEPLRAARPAVPPAGSQAGVVVKFDAPRGFGFIRPDSAAGAVGQDVFVHIHNVLGRRNLHPGQRVWFDLARTNKGRPRSMCRQAHRGHPHLKFLLIGIGSALLSDLLVDRRRATGYSDLVAALALA